MTDAFAGHGTDQGSESNLWLRSPQCAHWGTRCATCLEPCTPERGCARCRLYLLEQAAARVVAARKVQLEFDGVGHLITLLIAVDALPALLPKERTT